MLTSIQKQLATWIVERIRASDIAETFYVTWEAEIVGGKLVHAERRPNQALILCDNYEPIENEIEGPTLEILGSDDFLRIVGDKRHVWAKGVTSSVYFSSLRCTARQKLFDAVDAGFVSQSQTIFSTETGFPQPPEIALSLKRLRSKYPQPSPLGFLIMRFTATKPFEGIVSVIKQTAQEHDVVVIRADENDFHADLWGNVRTLLHACSFGIAVYDRIDTNEPNANIGLEVGYLMAMNKPVLLLKDKSLATLQSDLAGKLYKPFDPHDPEGTIPKQLESWLKDNGIVV